MYFIYKKENKTNWITPIPPYEDSLFDAVLEVETLPVYDYITQTLDLVEVDGQVQVVVVNKPVSEVLAEAKEIKIKEIEAYDKSTTVNSFTINGQSVWLDSETRLKLQRRIELSRDTVTVWFLGQNMTLPKVQIQGMLDALEQYAIACYDVTAQHKADVQALSILDAVRSYDHTAGYPASLEFTI